MPYIGKASVQCGTFYIQDQRKTCILSIWIPYLNIPIMLLSKANIIETNAKGHDQY